MFFNRLLTLIKKELSPSSEIDLCCKKFEKRTLDKMLLLIEENHRLKEELRLRDLHDNCIHDI